MAGEFKVGTVRGDLVLGHAEWDKAVKNATLGMGVIAGAIALVGKKAVGMASNFEIGMKEIATMLDETGKKRLPGFSADMKKMMVEFGEPVDKLQRGLYDILSAGIDASKAIDVLTASTKLAKAGVTDTAVATDALTTIINSYALSAEDAADVSDLLFSIVKRGKTTMGALAPSIGRVASLAASSGLSLNDMGAALATMTRSGLQTQEAITALRGITVSFLKPTKEAEEVAKQFGIELSANTLRTEGLGGVLTKLTNATEEQRASIFPNIRALAGMSAMLQNTEGFMYDLTVMSDRAGVTNEAFATIMDSTKVATDKFKQTVNALWIDLGEKLLPEFKAGVITATNFAKAILEMDDGIKAVIVETGKMVFVVTGLGAILGVGYLAVTRLKGAFIGLNKILALSPIVATATAIALLGSVALGVADKIINKNLAMATSSLEAQNAARKNISERIKLLKEEQAERLETLKAMNFQGEMSKSLMDEYRRTGRAITFYEKQLALERIATAKDEVDKKLDEQNRLNEKIIADDMAAQATGLSGYQEYQAELLEAQQDYAAESEELARVSAMTDLELWATNNLSKIENMNMLVTGMTATMDSYYSLQATKLANSQKAELDTARANYEAKKKWIIKNIKDEDKKTKELGKLEESWQATRQNISEKYAEQERNLKRRMRPMKIAEAVSGSALAVINALQTKPFIPLGVSAAVMAGIQGALQVAIIRAQPYQRGGITKRGEVQIVGERGIELAEFPAGTRIHSTADTRGILAGAGGNITINLNMDVESIAPESIEELTARVTEAVKDGIFEAKEMSKTIYTTAKEVEGEA